MTTESERLATRLDSSIYYDDQKAAALIRKLMADIEVLILQREDDKQAIANTLEALVRYQVKRQDFDRFHKVIPELRERLDLERLV
jgi:hypothetical protein